MLLDEPQACPTFEGLTFDALAVSPTGQHYLVVSIRPPGKPLLRVHLGPDPDTIARHGLIVVAALRTHAGRYADPEFGVGILTWLALCWTELATELDHATDNLNRGSAVDAGDGAVEVLLPGAARGGAVGAGAVA